MLFPQSVRILFLSCHLPLNFRYPFLSSNAGSAAISGECFGTGVEFNKEASVMLLPLPAELAADEFLMMTIRSHDQFNTTIYGLHDRYRGIHNGRRVVFVNEMDMKAHQLEKGDVVDIVSEYDDVLRRAERFTVVPYQIPKQCIATYFPEANVLVPFNHFARGSQTPISKSVVVKIVVRTIV